jgi:pyruvate ferredoxin oxidoreductase gamma subunit
MYRIRFHGRGGHGIKTGARILGSAFFAEGFEVQDAPRYGAERRGAPIDASVRAARAPIRERGALRAPDLVVVADETLVPVAAAGVLAGLEANGWLLIRSREPAAVWGERLARPGRVLCFPPAEEDHAELPFLGSVCAAAASRLVGAIGWAALEAALAQEVAGYGAVEQNLTRAREAWERFTAQAGAVAEGPDRLVPAGHPGWIELPLDPASLAAPDVHQPLTSLEVRTGLWRTQRPVIDPALCHGCAWICGSLCPDGAIARVGGRPVIDYDHCKGCGVCVAVCPHHAIGVEREAEVRASRETEARP